MYLSDMITDKISTALQASIAAKPEEYRFLDELIAGHEPVILCFGGSIAYGTNTPSSDIDIRGAAMASPDEILLGKDFEQIVDTDTDTTVYSFRKLVKLLAECNPNTIEMLGLKPNHYLYLSKAGKELLAHKDMFLSKRCINTFKGYAEQQLYRLRQKSTAAMSEAEFNRHIATVMSGMIERLETDYELPGIKVKEQDSKLLIDIDAKDYPMDKLSDVLGILNKTFQDYRKRSIRNEKAMAHGKIAKHSMHLLRLYMMAEDLLLDGKIVTYREKEHDLLMDIRFGKYLDETGSPNKDFFDIVEDYKARFERAAAITALPEKPDFDRIEKFILAMHRDIITQQS